MGFCQQSFKLKSSRVAESSLFSSVAPPKNAMMMMPTEDLICTGCGFLAKIKWMMDGGGGRLYRKKSNGGLWNETQHSKIVFDWQGRNPVFLPKKKKAGIRNLEIIDDFGKKPWCLGLWVARKRSISFRHWLSMSTWQAKLGSTEEGAIKKANQRQGGWDNWDQWTKNPHFFRFTGTKNYHPFIYESLGKNAVMIKVGSFTINKKECINADQLGDWRTGEPNRWRQ